MMMDSVEFGNYILKTAKNQLRGAGYKVCFFTEKKEARTDFPCLTFRSLILEKMEITLSNTLL